MGWQGFKTWAHVWLQIVKMVSAEQQTKGVLKTVSWTVSESAWQDTPSAVLTCCGLCPAAHLQSLWLTVTVIMCSRHTSAWTCSLCCSSDWSHASINHTGLHGSSGQADCHLQTSADTAVHYHSVKVTSVHVVYYGQCSYSVVMFSYIMNCDTSL